MLKFLRSKKNSKILLVIMAAIILVFMLWGIGGNRGGDADVIAKVDGEEILLEDFQKAYRRQEDYYRDALKGALTDEFLESLNLKQKTLENLISRKLILNNALSMRVKVSNEEVSTVIQAIAAFQKDSAFDKETYLTLLKKNRLFPGEFEDMMREDLLIQKMQDDVIESVAVTDEELKETYKVANREVKLNYLVVDIADFEKKIKVTENDAKAYLEKHKERFRIPTKIKAAYASIHFNDLLPNIKVSDEEIKDYYEKNAATFEAPKEVRASHILILPSDKDREESWQVAKDKAMGILKKIRNGTNFSKMAKQYSGDTGSATKGGDLGFFSKGSMVKPFEYTAFSLNKGEISEPVKTTYGYHIIKVTDIREAGARPLKEVKKDIIEVVKGQKAKKLAREKIDAVRTPFKDGKPLDELEPIVTKEGVKFTVTDFFSANERVDDLARYKDLRIMAFSMDANESSDPIELPHGIYVMRVVERVDGHLADYSEVTDDVTDALRKEMAETVAKSNADVILKRLKDGEKMRTLAKKEGLKLEVSGFTTQKQGYIARKKLYIGNRKDIFLLTKNSPYYNETIKSGTKFYILKLKDSKEPKEEGFEKTKDSIKERLLQEKQGKMMTDWINQLRSAAVVEVNQGLLK